MKRKIKKNKIRKSKLVRTTSVSPTQETLSNDRKDEAEPSTVLCKDCRYASAVESFITVDALHVQCPLCLYVFFMDESQRKARASAGLSSVSAGLSSQGRRV